MATDAAWGDRDDEWTERIAAAHPLQTGDAETYAIAMRMVGNRHSKAALVALVNWLLMDKRDRATGPQKWVGPRSSLLRGPNRSGNPCLPPTSLSGTPHEYNVRHAYTQRVKRTRSCCASREWKWRRPLRCDRKVRDRGVACRAIDTDCAGLLVIGHREVRVRMTLSNHIQYGVIVPAIGGAAFHLIKLLARQRRHAVLAVMGALVAPDPRL